MNGAHQRRRPASALDDVRNALQSAGHTIRPRGSDAFMASCPLHTDRCPSLSVTWRETTRAGEGGAVLMHCFSCQAPAADIAAALGLRIADLFDNPARPDGSSAAVHHHQRRAATRKPIRTPGPLPARITVASETAQHVWRRTRIYTYTTAEGTPVQQVLRHECCCNGQPHKRFQQRYREAGQWVYRKPEGFAPVLYRPAALRTAATTGRWRWIAEGEKDADTLTALGRLATTNAQGAANFPDELIAQFHGVKVAIVADRDRAGYQRARDLYRRLKGVAAEIAVLLPAVEADKSDVTEHVEARLWRSDEPFGGLLAVTSDELHALAVSAAARAAGHRFDVAVAEARAHQHRRGTVAGSARAAARWLAEAAHQLRTVQDAARNLQRHHSDHPYAVTATASAAVTALSQRLHNDYRHATRTGQWATPVSSTLKETA